MRSLFIFLLIVAVFLTMFVKFPAGPEFSDGQVILPDYAHTDTLVVVDAMGLNSALETLQPATDQEISDILYTYCKPFKQQ